MIGKYIMMATAITASLLVSVYVGNALAQKHQTDCNNHRALYQQLRQTFGNNGTLNGQLIPQIQYLNEKCSDLGMGNVRAYLER